MAKPIKRMLQSSWQRNLWVIVLIETLTIMAFQAGFILIPYYIQEMGVTDPKAVGQWTGIYQSIGSIGFAVFTPIWGAVGDRHGRKVMLVRAMVATSLILFFMGMARTPLQLMILRGIQGCVTGTPAAASALLATSVPREHVAYALGLVQTSIWVGVSIGPMVGGFVGDAAGYGATFLFSSAIVAICLVMTLLLVREAPCEDADREHSSDDPKGLLAGFTQILGSFRICLLIGLSLVVNLSLALVGPVLPIFVQQLAGDTARLASIAGTISGAGAFTAALAALVIGRLSDRVGNLRVLIVCTLGVAAAFLPQILAQSTLVLGLGVALQGLFRGGLGPNMSAILVRNVPEERTGSALGLSSSAGSAGMALGPVLGATLLSLSSIQWVLATAGVLFMLVSVAMMTAGRSRSAGSVQGRS